MFFANHSLNLSRACNCPPCSKERDLLEDLIVSILFLYLQLLEFLKLRSGSAWNYKCAGHEQILPLCFQ